MNGTPNNISRFVEEALLVIAHERPSKGEACIRCHLEQIGFEVIVTSADRVQTSDASGISVIVICSGSRARAVKKKLNDVAVPVVVLNHELFKPMRMARKPKKGIPYQGIPDQTSVRILELGHPMAAGLTDDVPVCDATTLFWAEPHHTAVKIASDAVDGSRLVWFAYERGSDLIPRRAKSPRSANRSPQENGARAQSQNEVVEPNPVAPARRVGLFFSDRVARHATPEGWSLFSAAVCWAAGREALLVVGSLDQMSEGDKNIGRNLQKFGYAVTVKDDIEASRSDAKRKGVIVLSSTVNSLRSRDEFRDAAVPIVVLKADLFAELGMTSDTNSGYGEVASQTRVKIVKGGHPMAAGRSGIVDVSRSGQHLSWGNPSPSASSIATQDGDATRTVIFGYKAGDEMVGLKAPARRVGLFISNGVAEDSTEGGWELFAAAIAWAVDSRDKEVLFVVGSNQANQNAPAGGDSKIKMRLEGLCYSVTMSDWAGVEESDADGKSLVVISSSVDAPIIAGPNGYNFADAVAPVLCMSPDVFPLLGMTGSEPGTDYGRENATAVEIADPDHSMAAGLQGVQPLSAVAVPMAWGNPWSRNVSRKLRNVIRVASHEGEPDKAALFGYQPNQRMPGQIAPSRRVGFCFSVSLAQVSTRTSWKLFDAAVNWAAGIGVMEFRDIFIEEWQEVLERRARFFDERASRSRCCAPENLVGLALSGGGIRSATFSLGLLQGLNDMGLLRIVDYLSTVSGGGYLGGWWSAWLSRSERKEIEGIFPKVEEIEPSRYADYLDPTGRDKIAEGSMSAGKDPIHHLRLFANYLTPRKGVLSGDTWRATAVVTRNLIMTWLIMVPVIIGFVLLGQLYFALQPNSLSDFLFPFWQQYGQLLDQRKDYASDLAEISPDIAKQDKFEQTAEYLAAKTGGDYKDIVAVLRREIAGDPPEDFSDAEEEKLKSFSAFLYGGSISSEKRKEYDDLVSFIRGISGDGYKGIVRQLDESGFRYISKCLPPRSEYDQRKEELGSLIEYFKTEDAGPLSSVQAYNRDAEASIRHWLRTMSQPVANHSLDDETQPRVEQLANSLSALSQKRIIDLRKELTSQSLDQEQTKVLDKIMEEATTPLRQRHGSDLRDRIKWILVPLLPIAALIGLTIILWMRTGMPAYSWAYISHWMGGLAVFAIVFCGVLLFMFPVGDILESLRGLWGMFWHLETVLIFVAWGLIAFCLWLYIRSGSTNQTRIADRRAIEEWHKEVRRNKIERVHATILVFLVITGSVLVLSGFGHEIIDYVWADPQPKKWLIDYVAKAGGWVAVITAIGGSIYTAVKASPSGGADNRHSAKETALSSFVFAITPTLVVVVLAVVAAWVAHWLLQHTIFESLPIYQLKESTPRFPPLTMATVIGVALCLYFAVYEMKLRKGGTAVAGFFAVCLIEVFGGFAYFKRLNPALSYELRLVSFVFVLAVGGLIFFRLMVDECDGYGTKRRPVVSKRFQLRVLKDTIKNRSKALRLLVVCSAVLPMALLVPSYNLLQRATAPLEKLSPLSICWLVGIIICLTFFVFEISLGKGDNRRSLWLAAVMYIALCALFVFSFYTQYAQHSSIMLGHAALGLLAMTFTWVVALGWMADPNRLSLHTFYKTRLVRAYMGASNHERKGGLDEITESVAGDNILLHHLRNCRVGAPYHIVNTTLSLVGGRDLTTAQRSAAVFAMSKRYCGSSRTGYRKSEDYMNGHLSLGTAVAVSGAAVSPTMGAKNTTASLAMLMTLLNIRLGYWAPTPNKEAWQAEQARLWPFYMLHEFLSQTNDIATYCYLTDGGHFDNTGLYSLVERGCRYIVIVDSGQDTEPCFQDVGEAIRRCRIDFGTEIRLNVAPLFKTQVDGEKREYSKQHFVAGTILYSVEHVRRLKWAGDIENFNRRKGIIVLIKPTLVRDEPVDLRQYGLENDNFPQQKTSDQWFDEAQFESYRRLGQLSAHRAFAGVQAIEGEGEISLYDVEQIFEAVLSRQRQRQNTEPASGAPSHTEAHAQSKQTSLLTVG